MSRTPPFAPHAYAEHLKSTGNYATNGTILWRWTGTHWEPFEETEGKTHAYAWIATRQGAEQSHISDANAGKAYSAAVRWVDPMAVVSTNEFILPVLNGYLHLENGHVVLKPHDKALGVKHIIQCEYSPGVPEPVLFKKFLTRVLSDEEVLRRVQEFIGYSLLHDSRFQRAALWIGSGANGKGVLANILQALHSRTAAVRLDNLDGFGLSGLLGASLIYCDEAPQSGINEQTLKSMVSGETVQIERKYRDPVSTKIQGKWLVLANHIPAIKDQSEGFWRRWDIVPFTVTIPEGERIPLLGERIIEKELAGVLNWAIDGLLRLLERKMFELEVPKAMQQVLHQAKVETNSVLSWFEFNDCGLDLDAVIPRAFVYAKYAEWCRKNGLSPVAMTKFWRRLGDVVGAGRLLEGRKRMPDGTHVRCCNVKVNAIVDFPVVRDADTMSMHCKMPQQHSIVADAI